MPNHYEIDAAIVGSPTGRGAVDFNQAQEPADKTAGKLWWDTANRKLWIANGSIWEIAKETGYVDYYSGGGFVCGGLDGGGQLSTIDKLMFNTGDVFVLTSGLAGTRRDGVAGFESTVAGYACGGDSAGNVSTIDKITFSDNSTAVNSSGLSGTRQQGMGGFASSASGYACSGYTGSYLTTIDKLTFSDDNVAALSSGTLVAARYGSPTGIEDDSAGYTGGGATAGGDFYSDVVTKLTFSNDQTSTNTSALVQTLSNVCGLSGSTAGYWMGGATYSVGYGSIVQKLTFSNDNIATNSSALPEIKGGAAGFESPAMGYACGGYDGSDYTSTIHTLDFSNDNTAIHATSLVGTRAFTIGSFHSA